MSIIIHKATPTEQKLYGCCIADPPWNETGGGRIKRGADRHYPLMTTKEICALGKSFVKLVMKSDSHLYLWVTNNFLEDGFEVLKAWGYSYVTKIEWLKEGKPGLGQYFRGRTESVLFARRGCPPYRINPATGKRAQGDTGFETPDPDLYTPGVSESLQSLLEDGSYFKAPRQHDVHGRDKHSKKPSKIHEWAELVSHGPYLEMFAIDHRPGWDRWGNGQWYYDMPGGVVECP